MSLMNMKKCAVLGDINIDIITPPFVLPEDESSCVLDEFTLSLGGNAANVAASLAALEAEHEFHGVTGDGAISQWIQQRCAGLGMNTRLIPLKDHSSGITFAMTFLGGRRQFIATLGTNKLLKLKYIDEKRILLSDHLHRAGFWYTPGLLGSPNQYLMKSMISEGKQTSLDVGWDPDGYPETHREILYDVLEYTQFFFLNMKEMRAITGYNDIDKGLEMLLQISTHVDKPVVILHQGPAGSLIATRCKRIKIETADVPQNNPTGTGDIYNAGFIYGLLNEWDLKKCGYFADKLATTHLADVNTIYPTMADINSAH